MRWNSFVHDCASFVECWKLNRSNAFVGGSVSLGGKGGVIGKLIFPYLYLEARDRSGRGSQVVKVWDRGWHVTSSSQVPVKTCRVGKRLTLNLSRAQTSSRWCGEVVRRGGCQLRCRPRHLTMVQNYEIRRQKPSCS
ncbi:uncharacterized protein TNCV_2740731 [Trichonephila clavipes]|nr:uncharacterized protein TNCV_2740731 [Trichonephila clavipes]